MTWKNTLHPPKPPQALACLSLTLVHATAELVDLGCGRPGSHSFDVADEVPAKVGSSRRPWPACAANPPKYCPLLGYTLHQLQVEGRSVARRFLQVDTQPEVGEAAYDAGTEILNQFFCKCLAEFREPDLASLARQIIERCLDGGSLKDYEAFIRTEPSNCE